jgi:signal peptidase II
VGADPARRAGLLYAVGAAVYLLDRVTKVIVEDNLANHPPVVLIPRVVQLNFTENPGGAFSLFTDTPWLFFGTTIVVSAVIVVASFRAVGRLPAVGLGLVLGGALGNLTDRLTRGEGLFDGKVVDFVDFHIWPVFNTADAAIVVGAATLLLAGTRRPGPGHPAG